MGKWKSRFRRGLVMMFTLAVAGSGMSFAIPQMPLEGISVEADSLVGVTLADIDEIAQREISVSQESLQAVAYASDGKGLKSNDAAIYQALKTCIEQVARGERTSTEFTLGTKMSEEALDRLDVNAIVAYLLNDCPFDLYWHDKTRTQENGQDTDGVYCKYYDDGRIVFSFKVAQPYRQEAGDLYTMNTAYMDTVNRAVQKARSIVETNQNNTDYDKLLNYRNAICDLVSYDDAAIWYDYPYGNSYQVISVFDDDLNSNVVCEGYAKAFKYLCDMSSFDNPINCYTVSGITDAGAGAGDHMWNIVRIGGSNGESYLVDVTNCDTGTIGEPMQLFMTDGLSGSVDAGYTFSNASGSITYTYAEETKEIYGSGILSLNNADHSLEAQTHVKGSSTYNNRIDNAAPAPDNSTTTEPPSASGENGSPNHTTDNSSDQKEEGDGTTGFAFGVEKVDKVYGDESFEETVLGTEETKNITYSSSDETVATVTKRGKVSIQGAGTTVITATVMNGKKSTGEKASYTLNVSPKELVWDVSGLYAVDRADDVQKSSDKRATLYGEIKLEGILPGEKDENSQFSFDSDTLIGTYADDKPGTQEVTLQWVKGKEVRLTKGAKSDNYKMPEELPNLTNGRLTSIKDLPKPESTDGRDLKLEMEDGISEVPEEFLKDRTLGLDTPGKIEEKLKSKISGENEILKEDIVVYDVSLYWRDAPEGADDEEDAEDTEDVDRDEDEEDTEDVKHAEDTEDKNDVKRAEDSKDAENVIEVEGIEDEDSAGVWEPVADDEKFPEDGVTVTLPYPDNMPRNVADIVVCHMYTADMSGSSPGEMEYRDIEEVDGGIQFTVYGLSPIAVGWSRATDTGQTPESENTETTVQNPQNPNNSGNTGQQNNQNNQNNSNKSPVTGDPIQILIYIVLVLLCLATIKGIQAVRRTGKKHE